MLKVLGVGLALVVALGVVAHTFMPVSTVVAEEKTSKATTYVVVVEGMS